MWRGVGLGLRVWEGVRGEWGWGKVRGGGVVCVKVCGEGVRGGEVELGTCGGGGGGFHWVGYLGVYDGGGVRRRGQSDDEKR